MERRDDKALKPKDKAVTSVNMNSTKTIAIVDKVAKLALGA